MKVINIILVCFCLFFSGCAKFILPVYPVKLEGTNPDNLAKTEFPMDISLNIVNAEPDNKDEIKIGDAGAYGTYYANKYFLIETIRENIAIRLKDKGIKVSDKASKTITLKLEGADFIYWGQSGTGIVEIKVTLVTKSGYSSDFSGNGTRQGQLPRTPSMLRPMWPWDSMTSQGKGWRISFENKTNHALALVADKIVNDKNIIEYIKN